MMVFQPGLKLAENNVVEFSHVAVADFPGLGSQHW
jgi:hypothetical protein